MPHEHPHHPARARRPWVDPVSHNPDRATLDDLLVAAGRGDLGAFAAFYDHTAAVVFGLLRAVLADPVDAERATGRVYRHLWATATRFDPHGTSAYALLLFTARRELIGPVRDLVTHNLTALRGPHPTAALG